MLLLCSAYADNWRGWRGLEKEGRAEGAGPIEWSPTQNIRWNTRIPGKGHSSPVVAGDNVVVTTAYPTERGRTPKRVAAWGVIALTAFVAIVAIAYAVPARWTTRRMVAAACFCLIAGAWLHVTFAARAHFGARVLSTDERMECWLFSTRTLSLALLVAAFALSPRSRLRLVAAAVALLVAATVVLGRPAPGYFYLAGPGRYTRELHQAIAVPLVLAAVLLLVAVLRRRRPGEEDEGEGSRRDVPSIVVSVAALVTGLLGLGLPIATAGRRLVGGLPTSSDGGSPLAPLAIAFGRDEFIVLGACLLAWLVAEFAGRWRRPLLPRWVAGAALGVAALGVVEQNRLLVTSEFVRAIVCVDRDTGGVRWVREGLRGPQPTLSHRNSPATPTPVTDGERIYAWFGTAGCLCTDLGGKVLWTNTDVPFDGVHGVGASPVLADGLLIVAGAQPKAPYITALDCETGTPVWTVRFRPWPGIEGQHRTPTIKTIGGRSVLLHWGWDGPDKQDLLLAYDVRTGQELWQRPVKTHGEAVASIISDGDTLYLPSSQAFCAVGLSKLARGEDPVLWTADLKGKGPYASSPVLCKGMLFMVANHRHAWCLDAQTGKVLWRERLRGTGTFPSPVAAGGRIYFCDKSGLTTVVAADREFRVLAENDLGDAIWASPAAVDGRLYIRTAKHLWCIEAPLPRAGPAPAGG